jgi:hypothetical protein
MPTFSANLTLTLDDDSEVELEVEGYIEPLTPARISGPPEDCYPEEGGFAEISRVTVVDTGDAFETTKEQDEALSEALYEAWEDYDNDEYDYDDDY